MQWHLHADVLISLLLVAGIYVLGLMKYQPSPRWLHPIERRHIVFFGLGLFSVYLAEGTPLHELSEQYLMSAHMLQHLILTLLTPPLLLLGMPSWLLRPFLTHPKVFPVAKVLTAPVVCIAAFNLVLAFWHVPDLYEATLLVHNVHILNHFMYLFTAVLLWWPIFSPLPELPRLSHGPQLLYMFIQSLVPAVLASMITFSQTVLYPTYAAAPRLADWLTPVQDQQIGGLTMKLLGGAVFWTLGTIVFFIWFNKEETEVEKSWD